MQFKEFAVKDLDVKSVYHLLISGISPRPIALVGSMDKDKMLSLVSRYGWTIHNHSNESKVVKLILGKYLYSKLSFAK